MTVREVGVKHISWIWYAGTNFDLIDLDEKYISWWKNIFSVIEFVSELRNLWNGRCRKCEQHGLDWMSSWHYLVVFLKYKL